MGGNELFSNFSGKDLVFLRPGSFSHMVYGSNINLGSCPKMSILSAAMVSSMMGILRKETANKTATLVMLL